MATLTKRAPLAGEAERFALKLTSAFLPGQMEEQRLASERTFSTPAGPNPRAAGIILISTFLWSLTAGPLFGDSPENPARAKPAPTALLTLPLSFEANQGQIDSQVKFQSRGDGYSLFLTSNEVVFTLRTPAGVKARPSVFRMELLGTERNAQVSGAHTLPGVTNYFIGNDPNKWRSGITTYAKVKYRGIYPGIDAVFYGNHRQLEYDFVIAPGADPKQIALQFSGARATLGSGGDLVLTLDGPPLTFRKPVVYQTIEGKKETIACSYKLSGGRVQFALGKYDHSRPLVIDPVLDYLTYLGGSNDEMVGNATYGSNPTQGAVVDATGDVYVTGYTQSTNFPVVDAIQSASSTTAGTGFVTKLNPAGSQLIYSTYFGGSVVGDGTTTRPYAIAVDGSGNAYVTGFTNSPKFPATAGAYQTACGFVGTSGMSNCPGAQSAFLTKLSPTGSLVYSTFFGHSNETGVAIAVDSKGQAYIAGDTVDQCAALSGGNAVGPATCFPTTANAVLPGSTFNQTLNPNNDNQGSAFISVFDAAGASLLYSSLFGGTGNQSTGNGHATYGSGVAVDASGNFYLAGTTGSNQLPVTPGAFQTTYYGNQNPGTSTATRGFVAKFKPVSSGASLLYTTYLGGTDPTQLAYADFVSGIAADAAGNAYVSGNASYDFPATPGAYDATPCPSDSICENRGFLAKLNPAGSALAWATFVGNPVRPDLSAADTISPPRLDAAGNVYVGGIAGDNTEVPSVNPLQPANSFAGAYVTMFNPTGSTVYFSTVIYNPAMNGQIFNSGVDVDSQGNIYVAGYSSSTGLPSTAGAFQTAPAGGTDAFIAKISPPVASSPTVTVVANAEGDGPTIAPNTWVEIKGSGLGPAGDTRIWQGSDFVKGQMPTQLDGVSVTMNGESAYVYYISPVQVNVLTPPDLAPGPVTVKVTSGGITSAAFTAQARPLSPSFFVFAGGYVIGSHLNGTLLGPTSLYPGSSTPAQPGELVVLYANGFGPTTVPVLPGASSQSGMLPAVPVVQIGGVNAAVQFAGLVAPGEYQFNVYVPSSTPNGDNPITVQYGGLSTQPGVLLTVQQ
jgi:uncharacterized protein (TIGR03437 family)